MDIGANFSYYEPMGIFSKKRIYADWAATTPIHPKVRKAKKDASRFWANPSAIHSEGVLARRALEDARVKSARILGVKPEEIYFTSGGTEANATIIQGVLRTIIEKGKKAHVVTTVFEHSSVIEILKLFGAHGVDVTFVKPGADGVVRAED